MPNNPHESVTWTDFPQTWTGCPREPLLTVLDRGIDVHGTDPVLLFEDGFSITGHELRDLAEHFAGVLADHMQPGDRVALAMGNRAEFVIAFLAVLANRGVVLSLAPDVGPHDARFALTDSGCVLAIADDTALPVMAGLVDEVPTLRDVLSLQDSEPFGFRAYQHDAAPLRFKDVRADLDDLVDIGYTSGTTGLPKALAGKHLETLRYIDVNIRLRRHLEGVGGRTHSGPERMLMPLQLHYGDPLTYLFAALCTGASLVLMRRFSASRFWEVARQTRATTILTIGSVPGMLLAKPESPDDRDHGIQRAVALAIPPDRHAELERRFGFPWSETYGSSESGPAISMPVEVAAEFVGSGAIGVPYPDIEARLVDDQGVVVDGPGQGELELRGEVVFDGYLDNPAATAEVMHDDWLRTGDLMRRDHRDVYYFLGRRKEVIRRSGVNVSPAEVEAVLRHHPDVVEAAVVPVEDEMMGEEIKAYVQLVPGVVFDPGALVEHCAEHLTRHKVPRYFEQRLEPFPRTATHRIPKNALKVDGRHLTQTSWDGAASAGRHGSVSVS